MIPENVKKLLKRWKILYLATSRKDGTPNLIAVESLGLVDNDTKILISDCHFNKTRINLMENNKISLIATNKKEYFQIKGTAEYQTSGKYFDKAVKLCEKYNYKAIASIVISINEIYNLKAYQNSRIL